MIRPSRVDHRPFSLIPQHFGSLLFDRSRVRYLPFDQPSTRLLERWIDESVDTYVAEAIESKDRAAAIAFAEHLIGEGILSCGGRLDADVVDVEPPADHLCGPLVTHVEIIAACNIACHHCFAGDLPRNHDPLRLDELDCLFADLASHGCFRVSLTGGEPLLRHDLFQIIDAAIERGVHPTLTTNAMLIDRSVARELGRRRPLRLNLSLDGSTRESNDSLRGDGVFQRVCENARMLRDHTEFVIGFTLTSHNISEAEACVQLARNLGAAGVVFRPLFPVGVATRYPELMPTFERYTAALKELAGADTMESDIGEGNAECGAGRLLASVSVQGHVNPCGFLREAFVAANIRDEPFSRIWNRNQGFLSMRTGPHSGGCRARALAAHGDVDADDPWHRQYESKPDQYFVPLNNLYVTRD